MKSLRIPVLFASLVLPALGVTNALSFNYDYTVGEPGVGYRDNDRTKLNDDDNAVMVWPNSHPNTGALVGFLGESGSKVFQIRFDFTTATSIDTASFYFAPNYLDAGVLYPFKLRIHNNSGTIDDTDEPVSPNNGGLTVPYTFNVGGVVTDHLYLDIETYLLQQTGTGWAMMSEASFTGSPVPEPSTYAAFAGIGALGFAWWRRRRRVADVAAC